MNDEYYDDEQLAKLLKIKVSTLANWVSAGKAPPHIGRGKSRRYPKDLFRKWERERIVWPVKASA